MSEKDREATDRKSKEAHRVEPDLKTDKFSATEQGKIGEMIEQDITADIEVMREWVEQRRMDLLHYDGERPSILENLTKEEWHSDRNLGLCPAVCDTYQATLFATTWNPDSMHAVATEDNDVDNKDSLMKFSKWAVGPNEGKLEPEIDDFIHNKIVQGFSVFKIGWKIWYEWVDKRMWNAKKKKYDIETSYERFEKGVMENINEVEDFLIPRYGKNIQELPHCIHVIHVNGNELLARAERGEFMNVDEGWIKAAKRSIQVQRKEWNMENLGKEKAEQLGLAEITDDDLRSLPVDIHVWYGEYERRGKMERYRFYYERNTRTFLAGKPLRKIRRDGKYPFAGGAFIRRPGLLKGKSLPRLIIPIVNAYNTVWNQKADFQFITNCPFFFFKPDEHYRQQEYRLSPGVGYPTESPNEINFPNIQRSMAWADTDFRQLFEMLEKLTGAATYFQTTERNVSGTATRDKIVDQKSETRFGLWVRRIQSEICEALTMYIQLYQEWAPPKLGDRILGDNGRKIFQNYSIEAIRGNYDIRMEPDIAAGSKSFEREQQLWAFEKLQTSFWLDPRVNPRGNWKLTSDTLKKLGLSDRYMPPEPPEQAGMSDDVKDEWTKLSQGEEIDPPEGATQRAMEHLIGHTKQKDEKYHELDDEYKPVFDAHLFKTMMNYNKFLQTVQQEKMVDAMAMKMIQNRNAGIPGDADEILRGQPRPGAQGMGGAPEKRIA